MRVVENIRHDGNAHLNEGSRSESDARFSAWRGCSATRLRWMRDVLMPVLSAALGRLGGGST